MRARESLVERYEDALIGLMLETGLENEGQAALEEMARFNYGAEIRISEKATKKNKNLINKSFARQDAKTVGCGAGKLLKKTFLVAAIIALLAGVAVASVPEIKEAFYGFLIEKTERETSFRPIKSTSEFLDAVDIKWVPEGYTLVDNGTSSVSLWNSYENESGDQLEIDIYVSENTSVNVGIEDSETQNITINGLDAILIQTDNNKKLVMTDEHTGVICTIYAETLGSDELLKMAESIIF